MIALLSLAVFFYALLPLVGAYQARTSWRAVRRQVVAAHRAREISFRALQQASTDPGPYRIVGELEAIEGRDTLWIGNGSVSLPVLVRGATVHFLENSEEGAEPGDPPRRVPWSSVGVLPEGTRFLIAGGVSPARGGGRMEAGPSEPLLVVAFSGDDHTVLARMMRDCRHPIEHWNSVTPISLVIGFLALLLVSYWELRIPGMRAEGLIGLALALLPSSFFLPPGIIFFYGFARLWQRTRTLRARRDSVEFLSGGPTFSSRLDGRRSRQLEVAAHAVLVLGAGLNALLLVLILRWTIP